MRKQESFNMQIKLVPKKVVQDWGKHGKFRAAEKLISSFTFSRG